MKLSVAIPFLAIAGGVVARNCKPGLRYCEQTLLDIGNYRAQIDQALADAHVIDNGEALFYCSGGDNGVISYIESCSNGCHDAGSGKSDYCN